MLTIEYSYDVPECASIADYNIEEVLFFDIETTGFSPDISSLYLIGCLFYKENHFELKQWFADDYASEEKMLHEFFEFLQVFRVLVHYNGTGFDLPYLMKKCRQYHLSYTFDHVESFDIYKKISYLKPILHLNNLKQKTIEEFIGLQREDPYNGGELIKVYSQYIQKRLLSKPCEDLKNMLLLHNAEDLSGLIAVSSMLRYEQVINGAFTITSIHTSETVFSVNATLNTPLPSPLIIEDSFFYLEAKETVMQIEIGILSSTLKYFYSNYKEYFYLPEEDTAIHKSVAAYVDKAYRQKAKACNCYTKKMGRFLPQNAEFITPSFRTNYKELPYYFELTDSFVGDSQRVKEYVISLLH